MKIKDMRVGEIWWFLNPKMVPAPKDKFNLCLGNSQFFVINTLNKFGGVLIEKSKYTFLEYDSYISFNSIIDLALHDEIDIPNNYFRQKISESTAKQLISAVKDSKVLTKQDKSIITAALSHIIN
jgi:hypothetical protein